MNLGSPRLAGSSFEPLTQREGEILALLADFSLSNQEIAGRLYVSLTTVKWHIQQIYTNLGVNNRRQAVRRATELGLLPAAASEQARRFDAPTGARLHNFPAQLTSFIGREREVETIGRLFSGSASRLVTLTGAGGVGKTRLALKAAEQIQRHYRNGVWLVELVSLSDPALLAQTVAGIFKLSEVAKHPWLAELQRYLSSKELLLVLDNCEHLIEACASLVDGLLRACLDLHILATSREALRIEGEIPFVVPSLSFPDPDNLPALELVNQFESVRLFVERAQLIHPGFVLTQASVRVVSLICKRLDGIPLALELAAARLNLLTMDELAEHLDDAFNLLTCGSRSTLPRHQTLRGVIDWSYNLLNAQEQILLRRLAVFTGGCTLEAATAVCTDDIDPALVEDQNQKSSRMPDFPSSAFLLSLGGLVDKSMVIAKRQAGETTRYHLLEMIRQYGHEKLLGAGEAEHYRRRHRDYFLQFAEANSPKLFYPERLVWIRKFEADYDNLRLALEWSYNNPRENVDAGPRLTWAMRNFWTPFAYQEPLNWAGKGLTLCQIGAGVSPAYHAKLLAFSPWITPWITSPLGAPTNARIRTRLEESLEISRSLGPAEVETLLLSLQVLAQFELPQTEDWGYIQALIEEREALIQSLGPESRVDPRFYLAENKYIQADLEIRRGQPDQARESVQECIRLYQACSHEWYLISPYFLMGTIDLVREKNQSARHYLTTAHRMVKKYGHMVGGAILATLCELELRQENWAAAVDLCKDYIRLAKEVQTPFNVFERLEMLARITARQKRTLQAAHLSGAAEALSEKFGRLVSSKSREILIPDWRTRSPDVSLDCLIPDWRTRSDGEQIQQAWDEGRAMTYEQAIEFALHIFCTST